LSLFTSEIDMHDSNSADAKSVGSLDARLLVLRIIEHDELAFETVYQRFRRRVFITAHRLLQSDLEAEEVLQDVFLALWRRPPDLPHGLPSLIAWFSATTRNQCWMRLRRSQLDVFSAQTCQVPEYFDSVHERIVEGELRCTLEREFLRAPRKHREVLELAYYRDMGATQIANHLRVPVITVRKRLELAIARLRRHLNSAALKAASDLHTVVSASNRKQPAAFAIVAASAVRTSPQRLMHPIIAEDAECSCQ
jgi:RNA polymerase sigma-70 factor, ECF subfamily